MSYDPVSYKMDSSRVPDKNLGANVPKATRAGWGFLVNTERSALRRVRKKKENGQVAPTHSHLGPRSVEAANRPAQDNPEDAAATGKGSRYILSLP
jgi:hypothetical protein